MPIAINESGTITGISVGGIPDGVVDTDVLAANAVTTAKLGTNEASGLAKAWVNFNGTSTVAIRASFNVSSITDNAAGNYTVNFTTAMVDANYSVAGTCSYPNAVEIAEGVNRLYSTTQVRVWTPLTTNGNPTDIVDVCVSIFR